MIEPNHVELVFRERRGVNNHIGTVHAIALCNGLEAAMGALAEATIPGDKRWIPKGMEVAYTAKATSQITCIAETDAEQWTSEDPDLPVRVRGRPRGRHAGHRGRHQALGDPQEVERTAQGQPVKHGQEPIWAGSDGFGLATQFAVDGRPRPLRPTACGTNCVASSDMNLHAAPPYPCRLS